MKLYKYLANQLSRIEYMRANSRHEEANGVRDAVNAFVKENFPSGSGFDAGTVLEWGKSTKERLVFSTKFHHMNEVGMYDGWTEHLVYVKPHLMFDVDLRVTGRNRNDIKDYIGETFADILDRDEDFKFL